MAIVTRAELESYSNSLEELAKSYNKDFNSVFASIDFDNIPLARDQLIEITNTLLRSGCKASGKLAATFYDLVKERSLGYTEGKAQVFGTYNPATTEGVVRASIQSVVETGETDKLKDDMNDYIGTEFLKSAASCTVTNGMRDRRKVRYARVLSGGMNTCRYCIMLASRGFVYYTEESASHFHPKCRCKVVPGFYDSTGEKCLTNVEGYDPDDILLFWDEMVKYDAKRAYFTPKGAADKNYGGMVLTESERRRFKRDTGTASMTWTESNNFNKKNSKLEETDKKSEEPDKK